MRLLYVEDHAVFASAVLAGVLLLGEDLPLRLLFGGVLLLGGIALSIRRTPAR